MMWSATAGCRLPRELSGRQVLTMIFHPLVLQVGKPQYNLLEEAPCCGLLHSHQEWVRGFLYCGMMLLKQPTVS